MVSAQSMQSSLLSKTWLESWESDCLPLLRPISHMSHMQLWPCPKGNGQCQVPSNISPYMYVHIFAWTSCIFEYRIKAHKKQSSSKKVIQINVLYFLSISITQRVSISSQNTHRLDKSLILSILVDFLDTLSLLWELAHLLWIIYYIFNIITLWYHFPFFFPPSNTFYISFLALFHFTISLFINFCYMHI